MKATFEQVLDFGAAFKQLLEFWSNFWATFLENWSNLWTALARLHRRRRPRAYELTLAMVTTIKSIHGFPSVSYMGMGLRLVALRAAGAPL